MNKTIKIKRGTGVPTTDILTDGELGFNKDNNRLYVGGENMVHELFGPGAVILPYEEYRELEDIDDNTIYFCTDEFDEILTSSNGLINMGITATASELNYVDGVTSNIQTQINNTNTAISNIWKTIYPIGAIYISVVSTSPAELFGGTWAAWGTGRVPVGINTSDTNFDTVEKTGGASTHTLTTAQMPSHTHTFTGTAASHTHTFTGTAASHNHDVNFQNLDRQAGSGSVRSVTTVAYSSTPITTISTSITPKGTNTSTSVTPAGTNSKTGSGSAHNNLQPYITCYMWKRTA